MQKPDLKKVRDTLKMTPYPVNLILEATSYCNLRCKACPYPFLKRPKGKMSDELFKKIINEVAENSPKDTIVWFAFMGEPVSLGQDLFDKIRYAKDKGVANIHLNTNAIFLDDKMAESAINSGVDKIIVSADALSEEKYNQIRIGGDYQILKTNVLNLLRKLKDRKLSKPEVVMQFIIMDENREEEESFKEYWLSQGATVKIRRKLGWGGSIEAEDLLIPQDKRNMPCSWLMRQMIILWNGKVAQCDGDYEGKFEAGDINNSTIHDIWSGELKDRRQKHLDNDFNFEPCNDCNDWQVGISEIYYPESIK